MSLVIRMRPYWPAVLSASALVACLVAFADLALPLRVPLELWFVLFCPGMALLRPLRLADPIAELGAAVALSGAIATLVGAAQAYSHTWQPDVTLAVLALVTFTGAALDRRMLDRERRASEVPAR